MIRAYKQITISIPFLPQIYLEGISTSPERTLAIISRALQPSMLQPMELQVPRTSKTVPLSSRARDLTRDLRAMSMI